MVTRAEFEDRTRIVEVTLPAGMEDVEATDRATRLTRACSPRLDDDAGQRLGGIRE